MAPNQASTMTVYDHAITKENLQNKLNTIEHLAKASQQRYPRSRGEYVTNTLIYPSPTGSPPLARGNNLPISLFAAENDHLPLPTKLADIIKQNANSFPSIIAFPLAKML